MPLKIKIKLHIFKVTGRVNFCRCYRFGFIKMVTSSFPKKKLPSTFPVDNLVYINSPSSSLNINIGQPLFKKKRPKMNSECTKSSW